MGRDTTEFLVMPFNAELENLRSNPSLLRAVSRITGGGSVELAQMDSLINSLYFPSHENITHRRFVFNRHPAIMVLLLLLLGAEWWYRKRKDMV